MNGSQDNIDESVGNGANVQKITLIDTKLVPWLMLACIVSALALGLVIANMVQQPQITDAKIDARMAELKADLAQQVADAKTAMAQQIADAKASANAGREHARVALSEVERANAELAAKGLIRKSEH